MASSDDFDNFIGPVLPPHLNANQTDINQPIDDYYGPALPPGYKSQEDKSDDKIIGPALPPNWSKGSKEENSSDEDDVIGPMPTTSNDDAGTSRIEAEFEKRADRMKKKLSGIEINKETKRDEWMTQLPAELGKSFGLGPRTFSRKSIPDKVDNSDWTDTPADKERKDRERLEGKIVDKEEEVEVKNPYDEEMAKIAAEYNESLKREESLTDIHKKQLKRKAKEEKSKPQERRPFDRDVDLKANRFDEAQRDSIIKRSRQLDSRFSAGKGNKYL
uniref:DUF3752 domain-containing protein n=1 Tax=Strigamia maritima TaxID=126957 RepID=T1IVH1_STRMM